MSGYNLFSYGFFDVTASAELLPPKIDQNPLFQLEPSGTCFKETLLQTGTPCRVTFNFFFRGFPDLGKAPAEGRPKPVQPQLQRAQG